MKEPTDSSSDNTLNVKQIVSYFSEIKDIGVDFCNKIDTLINEFKNEFGVERSECERVV